MTLDETTRFRITNKFVGILGDEDAAKLMDAIPPIDWDRFATKDDIAAATILTKAEMELEFAGVTVPPCLNAGFSCAMRSMRAFNGCSSLSTTPAPTRERELPPVATAPRKGWPAAWAPVAVALIAGVALAVVVAAVAALFLVYRSSR